MSPYRELAKMPPPEPEPPVPWAWALVDSPYINLVVNALSVLYCCGLAYSMYLMAYSFWLVR